MSGEVNPPGDVVYLHGMRVETVIGVFNWERQVRQTVILDIDMSTDVARAAQSDEVSDTLDYKAVAKRIEALVRESRCALVETLAERVAQCILDEFSVRWLRLRVGKRSAVRNTRDVGVVIERCRTK